MKVSGTKDIKDAVEIIANAGFEEITLFKNKEPRFIKITGEGFE